MKERLISARNFFSEIVYKNIFKKIFFLIEPEKIHNRFIQFGRKLGQKSFNRNLVGFCFNYSNPKLNQNILGLNFSNPIGLAGGFDKNADLIEILPMIGFGFAEVGSVTAQSYAGNAQPRLWRLKKSRGLVVNYGLKNDGARKIFEKIKNKKISIPLGLNIAKTNSRETIDIEAGVNDYFQTYQLFSNLNQIGYFTINVSCPNTYDSQSWSEPVRLNQLLTKFDSLKSDKPIFLKISPDLNDQEVETIIAVSQNHRVNGFICSNLTKNRANALLVDDSIPISGGVSGRPVKDLSDRQIGLIYKKSEGRFLIIGCGGIFSAQDAYAKIKLGASLVELITGLIFEGPQLISQINQGLIRLMKKDGFNSISQAIGSAN